MIKVFYGTDRVRAQQEIIKFLGGKDYEVIEGSDLTAQDLPNIFQGNSLFGTDTRKILIRDLFLSSAAVSELPKYLVTPHRIAMFETKLDKFPAGKALKKQLDLHKYDLPEPDKWASFNIYRLAKKNGRQAVAELQKIQASANVQLMLGSFASQAMKEYSQHPGAREKRVLRELSKLDTDIRRVTGTDSTSQRPWLLLQAFLLRLSSL